MIEAFAMERVAAEVPVAQISPGSCSYARQSRCPDYACHRRLTLEIRVEYSHSLKEKRHVVKSLKDRLRERFNVSVAEIDHLDSWQASVIAAVTVSNDRTHAEQVLQAVEKRMQPVSWAAHLTGSGVEWL